MVADPHKLLAAYKRGILTRIEVAGQLVEVASERVVEEFAHDVPAEIVEEIRQRVADTDFDNMIFIFGGTFARDVDWTAVKAESKRRWKDGCLKWRSYFGLTD